MLITDFKIGVVVPTRGMERKAFIENALRLISTQTIQPFRVEVIGHPPHDGQCDITYRYKLGYNKLTDADVIFFWEDDDWYRNDYIESMMREWIKEGQPDLFGTRYTIYYHLKLKKYFRMYHEQRASSMNTMIRANKKFEWGRETNPYTDVWLWNPGQPLSRKLWAPATPIAVGMKHGVGMSGGEGHTTNLQRYLNDDPDMYWLKGVIDQESFEFYQGMSKKLIECEK